MIIYDEEIFVVEIEVHNLRRARKRIPIGVRGIDFINIVNLNNLMFINERQSSII
jgi:hypothetical protein